MLFLSRRLDWFVLVSADVCLVVQKLIDFLRRLIVLSGERYIQRIISRLVHSLSDSWVQVRTVAGRNDVLKSHQEIYPRILDVL